MGSRRHGCLGSIQNGLFSAEERHGLSGVLNVLQHLLCEEWAVGEEGGSKRPSLWSRSEVVVGGPGHGLGDF